MRSFNAPHLSGALRSLTLPFRDSAMSFVAIPWLCFANRLQRIASLHPAVSFPIEANPLLLVASPKQVKSKPGPRNSLLLHFQSGPSNSNAMPSYSNAKLVNALALLFIALAVRNSADLCHRRARRFHAAALLLPASLCHFIAWPIKAAASHVRWVHFQRHSQQFLC